MTNNPDKIRQLEQHGITVSGRLPHVMAPNEHNRFYLETKAKRSGHFIDLAGLPRLQEQSDEVRLEGMPER
jgi:GTP cyclohydrolase II